MSLTGFDPHTRSMHYIIYYIIVFFFSLLNMDFIKLAILPGGKSSPAYSTTRREIFFSRGFMDFSHFTVQNGLDKFNRFHVERLIKVQEALKLFLNFLFMSIFCCKPSRSILPKNFFFFYPNNHRTILEKLSHTKEIYFFLWNISQHSDWNLHSIIFYIISQFFQVWS